MGTRVLNSRLSPENDIFLVHDAGANGVQYRCLSMPTAVFSIAQLAPLRPTGHLLSIGFEYLPRRMLTVWRYLLIRGMKSFESSCGDGVSACLSCNSERRHRSNDVFHATCIHASPIARVRCRGIREERTKPCRMRNGHDRTSVISSCHANCILSHDNKA